MGCSPERRYFPLKQRPSSIDVGVVEKGEAARDADTQPHCEDVADEARMRPLVLQCTAYILWRNKLPLLGSCGPDEQVVDPELRGTEVANLLLLLPRGLPPTLDPCTSRTATPWPSFAACPSCDGFGTTPAIINYLHIRYICFDDCI